MCFAAVLLCGYCMDAVWMMHVGCLWLLLFCCAVLALATSKVILQDDNGDTTIIIDLQQQ